MSAPGGIQILVGDCREQLRTLADNSVDAIVTDPPYHLTTNKKGGTGEASLNLNSPAGRARISTGFMGQAWDGGDVAFQPALWAEALRVLKPGGHILAFSGTRTYHRMVVAIEDAGFDIRDQIGWAYGTGFPKSRDIGGGWGTALKPSWEPICVARKPLVGTVAANVLEHGTGAINIDGCRVGTDDTRAPASRTALGMMNDDGWQARPVIAGSACGRWPANLVHDGSDEVVELFPAKAGAAAPVHKRNCDKFRNTYGAFAGNVDEEGSTFRGDSGSAARFFYCAKASRSERGEHNDHPTVKPIALMRWLCRLITPPGGVVLDPFLGSGTTGIAAAAEGFGFIGCELNPEYVAIAERRLGLDLA